MIGLSLLTLRPGRMGGSEVYGRGLVRALAARGELDYVCFLPPIAPDASGGLPSVVLDVYGRADTTPGKLLAMSRAALAPGRLRRRLPEVSAVHYVFTVPLPELRVPRAITLQDLLHRDRPDLWPRHQRLFRRFGYDRAARRAEVVIVPSEYVRGRVHEALGVPLERIRAVHYGIDRDVFRPDGETREEFLLYPARAWPHKNHERLLEAFARVRGNRPGLRLVLTGGGHGALPEGVESAGLVSPQELASLYRRAAALVFPSLHEGFGYPPLEAMACGCPVACSNATSLPEIVGDAAVLFDPESVDEIAGAIERVLDEGASLVEPGLRRAARFTWERCARGHEDVYRDLLG